MTAQTFVLPAEVADRARIADNLRAFVMSALPGKRLRVEVSEFRKRRSQEQNAYLWGVVYKTLTDATGNAADDLHTYFLGEWAGWETINVMGSLRRVPVRRSSKMTTVEFSEYVAFIQQRAAETVGVFIPDPE